MDRLKIFDRALLGKQIGGNGIIVIADTICLITGVFFGSMEFQTMCRFILFVNMFVTCILYHNYLLTRGEISFEAMSEKIVYFPTTRFHFLANKYAKTLILLLIQTALTIACLGLGYYGNRGHMEPDRIIAALLSAYIGILLTSGISILVMHIMPLGIYFSMLLYLPVSMLAGVLKRLLTTGQYAMNSLAITIALIVLIAFCIWLVLLWIGNKLFEKLN